MADVSSRIYNWSTNEASNAPLGTTTIGAGLDDNLRQIQATVRAELANVGSNLTAAATLDLGATAGSYHDVFGTTTISSFGTVGAGVWKVLHHNATAVIKYGAGTIITPGALDITAQPGDCHYNLSLGSGTWLMPFFTRSTGHALVETIAPFSDSTAILKGANDTTKLLKLDLTSITTGTSRTWSVQDRAIRVGDVLDKHGACFMTATSTTVISLLPKDGNTLMINSKMEVIPDAGVSTTLGAGSINTTYFMYAWMNSGTMNLSVDSGTYATQTGTGVKIKSGDATRTLVGMVRLGGTAATTANDSTARFYRSYFNRKPLLLTNAFSAARGTTSSSFTEINAEIEIQWVQWADESITLSISGAVGLSAGGPGTCATSIGVDSTTVAQDTRSAGVIASASDLIPVSCTLVRTGLAEGYHFATVVGAITGGLTTLYSGSGTAGSRTVLHGLIP